MFSAYGAFAGFAIASVWLEPLFPPFTTHRDDLEYAGLLGAIAFTAAVACRFLAAMVHSRRFPTPKDIPLCPRCGYNLTGNVSGICPECGRPLVKEDEKGP